ncbi:hypothetical protein GCM10027614_39430 [Micromonospora vulcania]
MKSLPKLNWGSAELRRRFATADDSVLRRWLRPPYALDGWRVDVANMTGRRGADAYTHEVAALLRSVVARDRPDGLLMAEHGHDHTGDLDRDGWHGTMNYVGFTDPVWSWLRHGDQPVPNFLGTPGGVPRRDAGRMLATMDAYRSLVSWRSYVHSWQLLGSHDSARVRSVVGDAARQEVAAGLLATMPGIPMIFAGDELGLTGTNGESSRTPMPWHRPESWDARTFAAYRALIALRAVSRRCATAACAGCTTTRTRSPSCARRRPGRCWCWPAGRPERRSGWPGCRPPRTCTAARRHYGPTRTAR